ncbi:MAG: hypothetical protein JO301_01205 [Chitinophagaceae bacterium]|nr:hypothetical protein [Chitinophagaceae bacterium]
MTKLTTYDELMSERQRLKLQLQEQKVELMGEMETIRQKLKPISTMVQFAEKLVTKDKTNPVVDTGLSIGVDLLLRKLVLRNSGWIVQLLAPLFVRNYLSHEIHENSGWIRKIEHFIKKKFSSHPAA